MIPDYTLEALKRYVENRIPTGGFLRAVLENNFNTAVCTADAENFKALREIAIHIYNEIPRICWGSPQKVHDWLNPQEK